MKKEERNFITLCRRLCGFNSSTLLIKIGNLAYLGVAPQFFEIVVLSGFGQEYVDPYVAVVDYHPLGICHSCFVVGLSASVFANIVLYAFGYGADLCGRVTLRYDEFLCCRRFYVAHIHYGYRAAFTFLYSFYYELLEFLRLRTCTRAQWEIRAHAIEALRLLRGAAPEIFKFYGPSCFVDNCPEGRMSCGRMAEMQERFSK